MSSGQANADPDEIGKFSYDSTRWWDPDGELKTLHDINPLRLRYITDRVELEKHKVIDVGCGGGILTEALAQHAARVTGIDLNRHAIQSAREHNTFDNLEYSDIDTAEQARSFPEHYDVLTCMELLEHVPEPEQLIKSCAALVKPGGCLFFSTINRNPVAYLKLILAAEYLLNMLPRGTHDYSKFIRPSELTGWCRSAGLQVREITGMGYAPLTQTYFLNNQPAANYLLYAVKTETG
ncbi:MAG: bifunctional 2-polyprenyl-6-hydroxyphenol methylase/3-demethylubiquinol 3-O-methyltransferase UbiG [Thiotrichales bacterium]|nr:bifunctional 2-polyprenyl-6-hydroxyphenol methylase/3-demethylubiquinol 3-O-methyltransferase UbiG [Thiotrichales bacterium]